MTAIKAIMATVAALVLGLCPAVARADYYASALTSKGGSITSVDITRVGQRMGGTRTDRLQRFYGAYSNQLSDGNQDATDRQAFQLAIWEIMYEGSGTYSLINGDLSVAGGGSSSVIDRANSWLAGSWQTSGVVDNRGGLDALPGGSGSGPLPPDPPAPPVVTVVPVPGAVLLGLLGFSLIGWVKRRFT